MHRLSKKGKKEVMRNSISGWFCTSNKNLFVKVVHPGGRVELHDRPISAAELLNRNPKCCVAHPTVFQQPYGAVVSPSTTLTLGQKYYVVPISTIRKLQKGNTKVNDQKMKIKKKDSEMKSFSWLVRKNKKSKKVKKGKNVCLEEKTGSCKKRANEDFSFASYDHWQPGLESITEE